jgi:peptidoglycan-N-acetylglucosamine deacetylase
MAKTTIAVLCTLIIILHSGCKKFVKEGHLQESGIALTFDDDRVDNWFKYLPLMDSLGVKATFYVCRYHSFTREQKRKLSVLKNHGHEIAFHGNLHRNLKDFIYKNGHSLEDIIKYEVAEDIKLMNNDGFYPTAFAYPYGAHDLYIDLFLTEHFKSVRALNGTNDFTKSIVSSPSNKVLFGLGIDNSSKRSDPDVVKILESVKTNNACAIFVAHDINSNDKYSVALNRLKKIAYYVKNNNLKYYTISEISN